MAISAKQVALASEAINRIPGLSPLARRVCVELIHRTDRNNGLCSPSEARLAISLGCDERSITRAKAELKTAGLLSWLNRGHHKRVQYRVMFSRLCEIATKLKKKIQQQANPAMAKALAMRAVKWRRWLTSTRIDRNYKKSAPTKMSDSPIIDIQHVLNPAPDKGLEAKAAQRFWTDIGNLPNALSEKISNALTETILDAALQAEQRRWGDGIRYCQRHI